MFDAEQDAEPAAEVVEKPDDALYCARCGHLVTRRRWAVAPDGRHERVCANPAGRLFTVNCFLEAPGAADRGPPTEEFTWFKGHAWNFAHCRAC
ncbi:MAG: cereblon family protein, partial [Rhodospirillales bacterium]